MRHSAALADPNLFGVIPSQFRSSLERQAMKEEGHLAPSELRAFALGKMSDADFSRCEQHILICSECAQQTMRQPGDSLQNRVAQFAVGGCDGNSGSVDCSKYEIVRPLGQGGMGRVYLARHRLLDRLVAIKVLRQQPEATPSLEQRFLREMKTLSALHHPNIAAAVDAEVDRGRWMLVVDYEPGEDLESYVKQRGPLCLSEAIELVRQAALGLQHAHQTGFLHRDVKPANLYRCVTGQLKVLDFGLACLTESPRDIRETGSDVFLGTPAFLSPEQALDPRCVDQRSDIYGLGATLFYLLVGESVFPGESAARVLVAHLQEAPRVLHDIRSDVPESLSATVAKMLEKDPLERFQHYAAVIEALDACQAELQNGSYNNTFRSADFGTRKQNHRLIIPGNICRNSSLLATVMTLLVLFWLGARSASMRRGTTTHKSAAGKSQAVANPAFDFQSSQELLDILIVVPFRQYWGPDLDALCDALRDRGLTFRIASSQAGEAQPSDLDVSRRRAKVEVVLDEHSVAELQPDIVLFTGAYPIEALEFANEQSPLSANLIAKTLEDRGWVGAVAGAIDVLAVSGQLDGRQVVATKYLKPSTLTNKLLRWEKDTQVVRASPGSHIVTASSSQAAEELIRLLLELRAQEQ